MRPVTKGAHFEIQDEQHIVAARKAGRELAREIGFGVDAAAELATVISELARNIVLYARDGTVSIRVIEDAGIPVGIELVAQDHGPGIRDAELAMRDGYTTSGGLGLGLPGARRLVDDFELSSSAGAGTCVRVTKWLPPVAEVRGAG